jgi:hypothetical protein
VAGPVFHHLATGQKQAAFFYWAADTGGTAQQIATDRTWITRHHDQVLAEGNRACAWIAGEPDAPLTDPGRHYSVEALGDRYIGATAASPIARVSTPNRRTIAIEAWGHLCHSDRDPKIVVGRTEND